jgi:D-arabinose 1-dehydrogenase-like Zn-dependent alcohol dehydrogenase
MQYALAMNYRVCGIDVGDDKLAMLKGYGIHAFVDFTKESDVPAAVKRAVGEKGAKAAVVSHTDQCRPETEVIECLRGQVHYETA